MVDKIAQYRKAIAAFLVPGLAVLATAFLPGSDGSTAVTAAEWVNIIIAMLGGGIAVAAIPNAITNQQIQDLSQNGLPIGNGTFTE